MDVVKYNTCTAISQDSPFTTWAHGGDVPPTPARESLNDGGAATRWARIQYPESWTHVGIQTYVE